MMNPKNKDRAEGKGRLPAMAPLANAYVPFQPESEEQYDPRKALIRGTMYPGLDLPFKGMVNRKQLPITPMSEMQVVAFAIQELALYLDTHQDDTEALELYHRYQLVYQKCKDEYEKKHGEITHNHPSHSTQYDWLGDPWPWEFSKNKEG